VQSLAPKHFLMRPHHRKSFPGARRQLIGIVSVIVLIIAAYMVLDAARPKIATIGVFVNCPNCPDSTTIFPVDASSGPSPTINVKVKNAGKTQAIITGINTTLYSTLDPDWHPFVEIPNHGYKTPVTLSSHSEAVLSQTVSEMTLYEMRNPTPAQALGRTFVYGHITYRGPFWFPVTTYFCFQYGRPSSGKAESWAACSV